MSGLVKGKTARFVVELEDDYTVLDPAKIALERDHSAGFLDTKLFLELAFRSTPTTTSQPLTLGKAAVDDLAFQHVPVEMALAQDRVRLLLADDVGLGKTLEAGLITSELISGAGPTGFSSSPPAPCWASSRRSFGPASRSRCRASTARPSGGCARVRVFERLLRNRE